MEIDHNCEIKKKITITFFFYPMEETSFPTDSHNRENYNNKEIMMG